MSGKQSKLYVGNIGQGATKENLQELFGKYGKVEECDIVKNFGFVHMSSDNEANAATAALHNSEFFGTRLSVEVSRSRVRQQPGMGGRSQCYRCGRAGHWSKNCPRGSSRGQYHNQSRPPSPTRSSSQVYRDYMEPSRYGPERMRTYSDLFERAPPPPPLMSPTEDPYYRTPYESSISYPGYYDRPRTAYDGYAAYGSDYGGYGRYAESYVPSSYSSGRMSPPVVYRAPAY